MSKILAILVDLPSPMICAKIRPKDLFSSGEDFLKFLPYMGMAAILVNGPRLFWQSFITQPKGGSTWNLNNIGPEASEKKPFEILNIFSHTNVWAHTNA